MTDFCVLQTVPPVRTKPVPAAAFVWSSLTMKTSSASWSVDMCFIPLVRGRGSALARGAVQCAEMIISWRIWVMTQKSRSRPLAEKKTSGSKPYQLQDFTKLHVGSDNVEETTSAAVNDESICQHILSCHEFNTYKQVIAYTIRANDTRRMVRRTMCFVNDLAMQKAVDIVVCLLVRH